MFCGCLFSVSAKAQEIKSGDLKTARNAVYEWISDYNVYAKCVGRTAKSDFYSLFEDKTIEIYNDYFPMFDYDFNNQMISVENYFELVGNKESYYEMKYNIKNGTIQSEEYEDGRIIFNVTFDKNVWFVQRGSFRDDRYEYPNLDLEMKVVLEYKIDLGVLVAISLICENTISPFLILHEDGKNSFEKQSSIISYCASKSSHLINYSMYAMDFDEKMIKIKSDTLKNYIGFGYTIGSEKVNAPISDNRFSNYNITGGIQHAVYGRFYQQLSLKGLQRWGVEVSLMYKNSSSVANAEFNEKYNDVDPDGGHYERIIQGSLYKETIKRHIVELPITLRYEYFLNKDFSAFAQAGASLAFDISRSAEATGDMSYSGYYDWLFDVTITQNGIYDFGNFYLNKGTSDLGLNKFMIASVLSVGGCYYFRNNWMIELAFKYRGTLWGGVNKDDEYHLSKYDGDWTSLTYIQDKYNTSIFNFQIQINYNF